MATVLLILQLLPAIIQIVVQLENIFKGTAISGAVKKQVLMDALAGQDKKVVPVASALADKVVGTFNTTGYFTHGVALDAGVPIKPAA